MVKRPTRYIYIAFLEKGKLYVGSTQNLSFRLWQHSNGYGSKVTKKYPPLFYKIIKAVPARFAKREEMRIEKKLEKKYGKNLIRGGKKEHAYNF